MEDYRILILSSEPANTPRLRLNAEIREVVDSIRRSWAVQRFSWDYRAASRPRDLPRALLEYRPHVVHFCGHSQIVQGIGAGPDLVGLIMEDERGQPRFVHAAVLADLFALFGEHLRCVILNTCGSMTLLEAIASHVDYVVGMTDIVDDRAAIEFAVAFYNALSVGRPVPFAHQLGCVAMRMARDARAFEAGVPLLLGRKTVRQQSAHRVTEKGFAPG